MRFSSVVVSVLIIFSSALDAFLPQRRSFSSSSSIVKTKTILPSDITINDGYFHDIAPITKASYKCPSPLFQNNPSYEMMDNDKIKSDDEHLSKRNIISSTALKKLHMLGYRFNTIDAAGLKNVRMAGAGGGTTVRTRITNMVQKVKNIPQNIKRLTWKDVKPIQRIKGLHGPITYLILAVLFARKYTWAWRNPAWWFGVAFCVKWFRARYVFKIPVWDRQPNWNNVITSKEQEKDLKAFTCKNCGSTIFIAKTREFFFEGNTGIGGLGCFSCGAKGKDNFVMDRERIVEDVAELDDYFEYERPLDFISRAERRALMKEAGGDEERANQILVERNNAQASEASQALAESIVNGGKSEAVAEEEVTTEENKDELEASQEGEGSTSENAGEPDADDKMDSSVIESKMDEKRAINKAETVSTSSTSSSSAASSSSESSQKKKKKAKKKTAKPATVSKPPTDDDLDLLGMDGF